MSRCQPAFILGDILKVGRLGSRTGCPRAGGIKPRASGYMAPKTEKACRSFLKQQAFVFIGGAEAIV